MKKHIFKEEAHMDMKNLILSQKQDSSWVSSDFFHFFPDTPHKLKPIAQTFRKLSFPAAILNNFKNKRKINYYNDMVRDVRIYVMIRLVTLKTLMVDLASVFVPLWIKLLLDE